MSKPRPGIEPVISQLISLTLYRWRNHGTVYIMAFIGLHILKGEVSLHLWWIYRTTSLLYLPSEWSKTGGYTVFTFVCLCECLCAHSVHSTTAVYAVAMRRWRHAANANKCRSIVTLWMRLPR